MSDWGISGLWDLVSVDGGVGELKACLNVVLRTLRFVYSRGIQCKEDMAIIGTQKYYSVTFLKKSCKYFMFKT